MSDILTFERVSFAYRHGDPPVLHDFTLGIGAGTATVILGPNGEGKSTLLNLALGWLRPTTGRLLLAGRPVEGYPRRQLGRYVALVPQAERTPFEYTVGDYVLLARAPHLAPLAMPGESDEEIARDAIAAVGLDHLRHRPITALSGGERQLVTLARALAQQPRVLLMDEPTAHLDLAHKSRLVGLVRDLLATGMTVVATTHEPEIATAIATDLVLLRDRRIYRAGPRAEVLTAANLTATYRVPVEIADVGGREVVLWT